MGEGRSAGVAASKDRDVQATVVGAGLSPALGRVAAGLVGVVIAAAGSSRRMQGADKLFIEVAGRPVLAHTVQRFHDSPVVGRICLVTRADAGAEWRDNVRELGWRKVVAVVSGGARRQDSVVAGLRALGPCQWVMVHDGARPCVTHEIILRGLEAARETGAAIAAVPAKDTIKTVAPDGVVTGTPPRETLWQVQTPQVFRYDILLQAYAAAHGDVTDDASLVEQAGHRVKVFMGAYTNVKVTTPEDVAVVDLFLRLGVRP